MIELNVPGRGVIQLDHLVTDVDGTLAVDGRLVEGVAKALRRLSDRLRIHMLTADTHGLQDEIDKRLGIVAHRIEPGSEQIAKREFVQRLGAEIGIAVLSREGLVRETLLAADLIVPDVRSALALLEKPLRLVTSLRQ